MNKTSLNVPLSGTERKLTHNYIRCKPLKEAFTSVVIKFAIYDYYYFF